MIPQPVADGAPLRRVAYVYLLQSCRDRTYYVGWTTDPMRRLVEHNAGQSSFTRRKSPWRLVGVEACLTDETASLYERSLKRSPRKLALFKKRILNQATEGRRRQVVG